MSEAIERAKTFIEEHPERSYKVFQDLIAECEMLEGLVKSLKGNERINSISILERKKNADLTAQIAELESQINRSLDINDQLQSELTHYRETAKLCPVCRANEPFGDLTVCKSCASDMNDLHRYRQGVEVEGYIDHRELVSNAIFGWDDGQPVTIIVMKKEG